ncbi:M23 family metallopeptidase [Streptosporangiaceae bacterium NEAU-GS5]|nr:M23 family metallopeptidase [Streptosporangiaceae bacterium NEAU-GS5]
MRVGGAGPASRTFSLAAGSRPGRRAVPASWSGWRWPLAGRPRVLRRFAPPPKPWLAGHRGVDLAAEPGDRVVAAGDGVVAFAAELAGRGVVVVAHRGGLRTTYLPVTASVRPSEAVSAGQEIGVIEDRPGHCATSCLHWGLRRGDTYLNPLLLVGFGVVRLLPTWPNRLAGPMQPGWPRTPGWQPSRPFARWPVGFSTPSAIGSVREGPSLAPVTPLLEHFGWLRTDGVAAGTPPRLVRAGMGARP